MCVCMYQHGLLELILSDLSRALQQSQQQQKQQRFQLSTSIPVQVPTKMLGLHLTPSVLHLLHLCVRHVANETSSFQLIHSDNGNVRRAHRGTAASGAWLAQVLRTAHKVKALLIQAGCEEEPIDEGNALSSLEESTASAADGNSRRFSEEEQACLWLPTILSPTVKPWPSEPRREANDPAEISAVKLRPLVLVGGGNIGSLPLVSTGSQTAASVPPSLQGVAAAVTPPPYLLYPMWGRMRRKWSAEHF